MELMLNNNSWIMKIILLSYTSIYIYIYMWVGYKVNKMFHKRKYNDTLNIIEYF